MTHHPNAHDTLVVRKVAGELLQYPDEQLLERLPVLTASVSALPAELGEPLAAFLDHVAVTPLEVLQEAYVATFDLKRKCCLYLSYYLNGDTRRRGMALVAFKDVYRRAGLELEADELPDFLPVVLEFAAIGDEGAGEQLLVAHRRGLQVLSMALADLGSRYRGVVEAVLATLPPAGPHDLEAAEVLAVQGPPAELVGMEPFGPPETTGLGVRS